MMKIKNFQHAKNLRFLSMNKITIITIIVCVLALFLISGCEQAPEVIPPGDETFCQIDTDCIPKPECHPLSCINKDFKDRYEIPQICTTLYVPEAARSPEDCICIDNKCINKNLNESRDNQLIGGQRDEHGCLGPAGYSWDEEIGACIRTWELEDNQKEAARIAIAPLSFGVTVVEVKVARCPGCFAITLQRNDNQKQIQVILENWEIKEQEEDKKLCESNNDCMLKYNVKYEGDCAAGCFNKDAETDTWCNENIKHEPFPPGTTCECKDNICELVSEEIKGCPEDARICPGGALLVRDPENNCEFPECPQVEKTYCQPEQRNAEICTLEYRPVCGWANENIQCLKYPCASTYSNPCMACSDENVEYWTEGECPG